MRRSEAGVTGAAVGAAVVVVLWLGWAALTRVQYPAPASAPYTEQAQVDYVVDGDTVRLTDGSYVRLLGIDAPEVEPEQCWSQEATTALSVITPPGTTVTLTRDPTQEPHDRYGRTLAYLGTDQVPDAAEQLLRQGAARTYTYDDPPQRAAAYALTQAAAQHDHVGVWTCPVP